MLSCSHSLVLFTLRFSHTHLCPQTLSLKHSHMNTLSQTDSLTHKFCLACYNVHSLTRITSLTQMHIHPYAHTYTLFRFFDCCPFQKVFFIRNAIIVAFPNFSSIFPFFSACHLSWHMMQQVLAFGDLLQPPLKPPNVFLLFLSKQQQKGALSSFTPNFLYLDK